MKPWVGAVAVATAILAAPSVALAGEDDPAQLQFKLPSAEAVHDFEALGLNMDHGITRNPDGTAVSQRVGHRRAGSSSRACTGTRWSATIHSKYAIDAIRAERSPTLKKLKAANDALRENAAGVKGKSAHRATSTRSARDLWENNVGRFLSIEANADGAHFTGNDGNTYVGPTVTAEWFDAAGNRLGGGNIDVYIDTDVSPDYYQYHYTIFRIGNKGDGAVVPTTVKVASSQRRRRHHQRPRVDRRGPPPKPTALLTGFVTHYNDSQEAYKKVRDLADRVPEHLRGRQAARADARLPAPGRRRCSATQHEHQRTERDRRRTSASTPTTCRSPARRRPRRSSPARSS